MKNKRHHIKAAIFIGQSFYSIINSNHSYKKSFRVWFSHTHKQCYAKRLLFLLIARKKKALGKVQWITWTIRQFRFDAQPLEPSGCFTLRVLGKQCVLCFCRCHERCTRLSIIFVFAVHKNTRNSMEIMWFSVAFITAEEKLEANLSIANRNSTSTRTQNTQFESRVLVHCTVLRSYISKTAKDNIGMWLHEYSRLQTIIWHVPRPCVVCQLIERSSVCSRWKCFLVCEFGRVHRMARIYRKPPV